MSDAVHILDEKASPDDALVWTMWCGHQALFFADGESAPPTNFYTENAGHKASCEPCKRACFPAAASVARARPVPA